MGVNAALRPPLFWWRKLSLSPALCRRGHRFSLEFGELGVCFRDEPDEFGAERRQRAMREPGNGKAHLGEGWIFKFHQCKRAFGNSESTRPMGNTPMASDSATMVLVIERDSTETEGPGLVLRDPGARRLGAVAMSLRVKVDGTRAVVESRNSSN